MSNNILITGDPRTGKTTLLEKVLKEIQGPKKGFLTREVFTNEERSGFELVTDSGETLLLASTTIESPHKVSKYGVDVKGFEKRIPGFHKYANECLYIDEIGQMELNASSFEKLVMSYLDAPNQFIGVLSQTYEHTVIDEIKKRNDVTIFQLTEQNREEVYNQIQKELSTVE